MSSPNFCDLRNLKTLIQIESHAQTTDRRIEKIEEDMRVVMAFLGGSPQIPTRVSIGFIYLVDATGQKHPVPMNMALSFEVGFFASDVSPSRDHPDYNI